MNSSKEHDRVDELRKLPLRDVLEAGDKLMNVLTAKLQILDIDRFEDHLLEVRVRLLLNLLRESLADRYQALSILAFAHIVVALDYFLKVNDDTPDTYDGGYMDDLQVVQRIFSEFEEEIDAFEKWLARQPKDDAF